MALAEDAPLSAPSWRLATPALKRLRLPGSCWDVWNAMCDLQAGRHRYVFAGALALAEATGRCERTVYYARRRLEKEELIRTVIVGGGRRLEPEKGSPGDASVFALGRVAEEALARKKGAKPFTLVEGGRMQTAAPFNGAKPFTPSSSPSGALPPQSTPDVDEEGRPASRPAHGLIRPQPGRGGDPVRLGTLLSGTSAGPSEDPLQTLLDTPLSRPAPDLDLLPPKRRRK